MTDTALASNLAACLGDGPVDGHLSGIVERMAAAVDADPGISTATLEARFFKGRNFDAKSHLVLLAGLRDRGYLRCYEPDVGLPAAARTEFFEDLDRHWWPPVAVTARLVADGRIPVGTDLYRRALRVVLGAAQRR